MFALLCLLPQTRSPILFDFLSAMYRRADVAIVLFVSTIAMLLFQVYSLLIFLS